MLRIEGIAASIISTESPQNAPMVVCGKGPRVRIYCLYDDEAISGDDANETALAQCPTEAEWVMSLPADTEDLEWLNQALAKNSNRVTARDKKDTFDSGEEKSEQARATDAAINMEAFLRP